MFKDNNFARDTYSERMMRLYNLTNSINDFAAQINLSTSLINWAIVAENEYQTLNYDAVFALNGKDDAAIFLKNADNSLIEKYQICKNLLISVFRDSDKMDLLGIKGTTPRKHNDIVAATELMLKANNELVAEGNPGCLPVQFVTKLQNLLNNCVENKFEIGKKSEIYRKADKIRKVRFESDSSNLRIIYNHAVAYLGKSNPDLTLLGFAIYTKKRGRKKLKKKIED